MVDWLRALPVTHVAPDVSLGTLKPVEVPAHMRLLVETALRLGIGQSDSDAYVKITSLRAAELEIIEKPKRDAESKRFWNYLETHVLRDGKWVKVKKRGDFSTEESRKAWFKDAR